MTSLTPLHTCLDHALAACLPVAPQQVALDDCVTGILAEAVCLAQDMPQHAEALRSGYAVAALDMMGASPDMPLPLGMAQLLHPADPLPPGCDASLPPDAVEDGPAGLCALRAPAPGEGVRRRGHDGRAGTELAPAGAQITPRLCLLAGLAGHGTLALRRPRLRLQVQDPDQARYVQHWAIACGAQIVDTDADLTLATTSDHSPKLAFTPAESAWLSGAGGALVLHLPRRFDGVMAALLGLGLPAIAALTGASPRPRTGELTQKISSAVGLSELVLLAEDRAGIAPFPPGVVTLANLAKASAFAILPPESEGLPAGAALACTALDQPFG
jgi:molybdopterin molybdotransferase